MSMTPAGPSHFDSGELEVRQLLFLGPADETADLAAVAGFVAGQPGVQVALPSRRDREVAGGAPVEQFDRRPHVLLNDDGLPVGGIRTAQAGPQSPQEMPHRVGVEQLLFAGRFVTVAYCYRCRRGAKGGRLPTVGPAMKTGSNSHLTAESFIK
jgi:hypothetical protein